MNTFSFQFKRSLYSPTDLFNLGTRLNNAAGDMVGKVPNGELVVNTLKGSLGNMILVTERDRANPVTAGIHETDSVRDNDLHMIKDTIKARTHNVKNSAEQEAAKALLKIFSRHVGNIATMGLGVETKAVNHLIDEMTSAENKERCDLTGITPLIDSLSQTQKKLDALYVERDRLAPEPGRDTVKNAMTATVNAVHRFLGFVDIMVAGQGEGVAELATEVRSILTDVEAIARSRRTRIQNHEADQPEELVSKAA
jgi:hypothetical protein